MPRSRSPNAAGVAGFAGGLGLMWAWALTTPASSSTVEIPFTAWDLDAARPDPVGVLWPFWLLLAGTVLGALGWIVLVERRRPERLRIERRPWPTRLPGLAACLSMLVFIYLFEGMWHGFGQTLTFPDTDPNPQVIQVTTMREPAQMAAWLTFSMAWYFAVYGAVRLATSLLPEPPPSEEPPPQPRKTDWPWDSGRRLAALGPGEAPLFRDDPDAVR